MVITATDGTRPGFGRPRRRLEPQVRRLPTEYAQTHARDVARCFRRRTELDNVG